METIQISQENGITVIKLDRGKANPINHTMVNEIRSVLAELSRLEEVGGVILTGKEHFFSAGLDLPELYQYDKPTFERFWNNFLSLIVEIMMFEKPIIAAVTGHSPAGGCVLTLGCDYKIMSEGNYKIGLNEIPVGIIVPRVIFEGYAFHLGANKAYTYLMEGKLYSPAEAKEIGLIDEVAPPEETLNRAIAVMRRYLSFNRNAWLETKKRTKIARLKPYIYPDDEEMTALKNHWWDPATRAQMEGFILALHNKKS